MSRIAELIAKLAPEGVRFMTLGEVLRIKNGRDHKSLGDGDIPVYGSGGIMRYVDAAAAEGPSVLIPRKGSLGNIFYVEGPFWVVDTIFRTEIDTKLVEPKFVYHQLMTMALGEMNQAGGVPSQTQSVLNLLRIPVPPLDVQREIVRVLDQFAELVAELEAELEARRAQYDYYAGELLTVDQDVPRVRFGSVATIGRGASPRPIQQFLTDDPDGAPWIKIGDVPANGKYITRTDQRVTSDGAAKSRRVMPGDFVLSNSMSFGRPYISKIEGYIHDGWLAIGGFNDSYVSDYLYYLLRSAPVQEEFKRRAGSGTVQNLNAEIVRSVEIPLPSREVQERVVALLDRFDALVNDTSIGLPAELNARRHQYEYYRDKLLTFEEAD
ncbi:restriction endonuclease subunit S [Sphingomonas sp. LR61]|uniref:restriction endonuclease subunit S n=1 Tax=Sphingomonas sp. LR61 TaxID=3050234 RepID=UPI002FE36E90